MSQIRIRISHNYLHNRQLPRMPLSRPFFSSRASRRGPRGCGRFRQLDGLAASGKAAGKRTSGYVVGGGIDFLGVVPLAGRVAVGGAVAIVVGSAIMLGEYVHNAKAEKRAELKVKHNFIDCCTACGIWWKDPEAARNHIKQAYPDAN